MMPIVDHATIPMENTRPGSPRKLGLPRAPVFGWSSFAREGRAALSSVDKLPRRRYTTSGRAALYHALQQLGLPSGSVVLVPSYHCPTMVAPVLHAGMQPRFFGIGPDGLPDLARISLADGMRPSAMIAAHYFGLPRSMAAVRGWCDQHHVALIEDCAHSFFGRAGERPVGAWGDVATASISKFFPVPEAGVLASAFRDLAPLRLQRAATKAQLKGLVDITELGTRHRRFGGLNSLLAALFRWKNRNNPKTEPGTTVDPTPDADNMMRGCDMGRIKQSPLWVSLQIAKHLPRQRIVARRRANFAHFLTLFGRVPGARPLAAALPEDAAPYVFPLWVDDADRVYHALRGLSAPAFRWDHIWPGTPALAHDCGPLWSRHVLQLLCHQDLEPADIELVASTILQLLPAIPSSEPTTPRAQP